MFDLWYATGAAIMFPELLDAFEAQGVAAGTAVGEPLFYPVPSIQFCDGGKPNAPIVNPNLKNQIAGNPPVIADSGFIVASIIDEVRVAIKDLVHERFPFAPPISLYTAGKLCQVLTVKAFDWKNNIKLANQGYQAAVKSLPTKRSPNFPAFLGVFLLDPGLTNSLSGAQGPPTAAQQALAEFQITDPGEIAAFQSLVTPGNSFINAQAKLLGPPTWTTCREQFLAWSGHTDAMVI
jgi:hypothetical protein